MKTFYFILLVALVQLSDALPSNPFSFTDMYIVNGEAVRVGEFPHQLLMEKLVKDKWSFACGAVLISKTQALTAAHCVAGDLPKEVRVIAGLHNKTDKTETQTTVLKKIKVHQNYSQGPETFGNDIAVITFLKPIKFTSTIQPIEWNDDDSITFAGDKCHLSGWGRDEKTNLPDVLQKVYMRVISNVQCRFRTLPSAVLYKGHLCAYEPELGVCGGDSGGPMTCYKNGKPILAGVTSWGVSNIFGKCNANFASVYSRISYFKDFINENLK